MRLFNEGEEAAFFASTEELIEKIRRYLPDGAARNRIAASGRTRAMRDGYDNDSQMRLIVERMESTLARKRTTSIR
jgi:spore maturation protein CgeB